MINDKRIDQLMDAVKPVFAKFPRLPKGATDILVTIAPWLALIFGILGALSIVTVVLGLVGLSGAAMMYTPVVGAVVSGFSALALVGLLIGLAASIFELLAFSGLKDRKMVGWRYLFLSQSVSILGAIVAMNLIGAVLSFLIGYYLLFEVRSYYK
jgi:hypothetical protein